MALSLQTFAGWVSQQVAAVQASATQLLDFAVGSVLRAVLEANAGVALWLQWLILQVQALGRAATSNGTDLDSWMADFGFTRLPAIAASGTVTFSRFTTTTAATIPLGTTVQTADGTQSFATTAALTIAAGTASGSVAVQAANLGTQGNVLSGTVTVITSAISGVDTVTNASAFTTGVDAESDDALRARFVAFINSRAQATKVAVGYAVSSVQQGLSCTIQENTTTGGGYAPGTFVVTVDNGTGSPPSTLLSAIQAAIDSTARPLGSIFSVQGPSVVTANVAFTLTAATGYTKANLTGPAALAVTDYINALPMGAPLPYSRLPQVIYDSIPGIANVTGLTVNSGTADVGGSATQVVRAGTVTAS